MKPVSFQITQGQEALTSHSGLALIGALMGRTRLAARVDEITLPERPRPEVSLRRRDDVDDRFAGAGQAGFRGGGSVSHRSLLRPGAGPGCGAVGGHPAAATRWLGGAGGKRHWRGVGRPGGPSRTADGALLRGRRRPLRSLDRARYRRVGLRRLGHEEGRGVVDLQEGRRLCPDLRLPGPGRVSAQLPAAAGQPALSGRSPGLYSRHAAAGAPYQRRKAAAAHGQRPRRPRHRTAVAPHSQDRLHRQAQPAHRIDSRPGWRTPKPWASAPVRDPARRSSPARG